MILLQEMKPYSWFLMYILHKLSWQGIVTSSGALLRSVIKLYSLVVWTNGRQPSKTIETNGCLTQKPSKNHWTQWLSLTIPSSDQWWTTIENHPLPMVAWPKNHRKTIVSNGCPFLMVSKICLSARFAQKITRSIVIVLLLRINVKSLTMSPRSAEITWTVGEFQMSKKPRPSISW